MMPARPSEKGPPQKIPPRSLFVRGQEIRLPPDEGPRFILTLGDEADNLAPHSSDGAIMVRRPWEEGTHSNSLTMGRGGGPDGDCTAESVGAGGK